MVPSAWGAGDAVCQHCQKGGRGVYTGKGEEIPATVQTVEREKQFAASLQQTVVRQAAPGRARKEVAAATPS